MTNKVRLDDNLIIHGDNLKALKALLPTYAGKVKCIYIDPPYNTGNEGWVYSDNVSGPVIKEWIGKVVGKEGEDLTRHDKWLCMMTPRLKLLRELLNENGVMFISIDEFELGYLSSLLNEIFGDNNLDYLVWRKTGKQSNTKQINRVKTTHEYIVIVYKNKASTYLNKIKLLPNWKNTYTNPDNDPRGIYKQGIISNTEEKSRPDSKNYYSVTLPSGKKVTREWYISEKDYHKLEKENRIYVPKNGDGIPAVKIFENEEQEYYFDTIIDDMGSFSDAKDEIAEIFGDRDKFDTPKPSKLIKEIIRSSSQDGDIILDSFAGTGTTAQAVLELNKQDGGNRKFILVEMEDYADNITAERVRRVIKGVPTANNELVKAGLGGTFSYFDLGDAIEMESLLQGKGLPSYLEMARYLYYTATGDEFDEAKLDEKTHLIGENEQFKVFAYYQPNLDYLKTTALTLDQAKALRASNGTKQLLIFAPTKYVETESLNELKITFCQLPYEIYRMKK